MLGFKNISIKNKLIIIQVVTAIIAVSVCCVIFVFNDIKTFKKSSVVNLYSIAEIVGVNSVSPLLFVDQDAADTILLNLNSNASILGAAIFDKTGKEFAVYTKKGEEAFLFPISDRTIFETQKFFEKKFIVSYQIFYKKDFLGTVMLRAELIDLNTIIYNYIKIAILILILGTFSAFIISNLFQRIITNRLLSLVYKTKEVAETNNYSIRVPAEGRDEIGVLSRGFNTMLEEIEKTQRALKEINMNLEERVKERTAALIKTQTSLQLSEDKYRKIVEEAGDVVYSSDYKGYFTYINPICKKLTGYTENEMIGKLFLEIIDPEWKEKVAKFYKEQFDKKIKETLFSFPIITKSGEKKWVEQIVVQQKDGDIITGHQAIVRDITQRKKIEEEIKQKSEELSHSNQELEQFAYVASHDLQEPLRTVTNFVGLLEKEYVGKTDEEANLYLKFIVNATSKMQILIKDLLDFSRVGRNIIFATVDCNKIFREVVAEMDATIKESNTKITASILPLLIGNEMELKRLFQNLISNAIKFRKKNIASEIEITVEEKDTEYLFAVKDNGIGIEENNFNKLFIIFQRLNNTDQYQGTGIGLATCKKIVGLHNGKIWVKSKLGEGSIFYFTLSKQLKNKTL